ncbi:putative NUDIX family NTP pyrophosphohydrolase [Agromyces flavus]|uniref:NUDIX family NTP pyrophosphohydrolase n=1 Tax=Agromyces flavus TaxID=589382 RepID=A0A1H1VQU0_9MICO|nr:NUDIX domain-containing protein [Agromyces flavus]MCP2365987.1 putative NUDIX family NTP pyrophosphohydrolase [Agromyces flavus]SDS87113.1 Predicted NTP pyrophosphohydrolase, NUDIX family [Agromyces flavus]
MPVTSAGVLLYRRAPQFEVLVAHMGGPFWARKQEHAWSIPKGELDADEEPRAAALREFAEELGLPAPEVDYADLGTVRYASGKLLHVFAGEATDFELDGFAPGTFELEWPPRSGRTAEFPEVDDVRWAGLAEARTLLVKGQLGALDALERHLATSA